MVSRQTRKERGKTSEDVTYSSSPSLNRYGEVQYSAHEPVLKMGEKFYSRHDKQFYFLEPPPDIGGSAKRINLVPSSIGGSVAAYFSDIARRKKIEFDPNSISGVQIYEGEIPFRRKVGDVWEYAGVKADVGNGKEIIIVDSRLSDSEKVATVYHELVHKAGYDFPAGKNHSQVEVDELEKKTQLETISGLRKMAKDFSVLAGSDYQSAPQLESSLHYYESNPNLFRDATNYAISSRKIFDLKRRDVIRRLKRDGPSLEKRLSKLLFFGVVAGLLFLGGINLNGNVIGSFETVTKKYFSFIFLVLSFFIALLFFWFIYLRRRFLFVRHWG